METVLWNRCDIVICRCSELSYAHVHCLCNRCKGGAVSRSVEWRHWTAAKLNNRRVSATLAGRSARHNSRERSRSPVNHDGLATTATATTRLELSPDTCTSTSLGSEQLEPQYSALPRNEAGSEGEVSDCTGITDTSNASTNPGPLVVHAPRKDLENDMVWSIVQTMQLADNISASQQQFVDMLHFGQESYKKGLLIGNSTRVLPEEVDSTWPKSWQGAMKVITDAGYEPPVKLNVCLSDAHPCNWDVMKGEDRCRHCGESGNIPYYYLSLSEKIRRWCSTEESCHKMTAHWRQKDHWLNRQQESKWVTRKEIWDGDRFSELSWFWDPESNWLLPAKCPHCCSIISPKQIEIQVTGAVCDNISCLECYNEFEYVPKYARGDPRNIALIGHWDGFRPFRSTGKHGCGSIDFTIATMEKSERVMSEDYVSGFVPCHLLPHKRPCSLDPFLDPLITEIEDIFVNGIEVDYRGTVAGIAPGRANIRCILLCWTGDYPAQCEVGKFIKNGKRPCRRDTLEGTLLSGSKHYYFGDTRFHAKYPFEERCLADIVPELCDIEEEDRPSVRRRKAKEAGFTGLSILHRLSRLYGFDVLKDTVFDAMHNIALNVVHQHLQYYIEEGLLSKDVEVRLSKFPWTAELRSGRLPEGLLNRLGYWKAEELQKFAFPASECVLGGILPDKEYHIWILITRLTELVYGCGRNGWTFQMVQLARHLVLRHNILTEEARGLKSCHVTLHNLIHMVDDVERFSSPDNFWCYVHERAVHKYVERTSNGKNIEHTYARAEALREFLKFSNIQQKNDSDVKAVQEGSLVYASSIENAQQFAASQPIISIAGIFVGKKTCNLIRINTKDIVGACISEVRPEEVLASSFHSIFMPSHGHSGILYRVGEFVLVEVEGEKQAVVRVCDIFAIKEASTGNVFNCIMGEIYYGKRDAAGEIMCHIYSDSQFVVPSCDQIVVCCSKLLRKVILYPDPENIEDPSYFIFIDYLRPDMPLQSEDVIIPFFPEKDDMVLIVAENGKELWLGHIQSVDVKHKTCNLHFYVETSPGSKAYLREQKGRRSLEKVQWAAIAGLADGFWYGKQWIRRDAHDHMHAV